VVVGGWWRWSTKITITCRLKRVRRRRGEKKESVTEKRALLCESNGLRLLNVSNLIFIFLSRGEKENKRKRKREILKKEENRN